FSAGMHDDGVFERSIVVQNLAYLSYLEVLLADRYIDADEVFALLIDDSIHRHRGLTGLAVADDQLTLAATNGNQRIYNLQASQYRSIYRVTGDDARGYPLDRAKLVGDDWTAAIQRLAQ